MYRITTENNRRWRGRHHLKPHFCSNYFLTQEVVENMNKRYNCDKDLDITTTSVTQKKIHWDDGGMILSPKRKFQFNLGRFFLVCYLHQWESFLTMVKLRLEDDERFANTYDGKFWKLHGNYHVVCLTPKERDTLLREVKRRTASCNKKYQEYLLESE